MSHPTFANNKDRLTYLLAEYKMLVSGMILGAIALVMYYQPTIPSPPTWLAAIAVGWLVLGVPCYLVGLKIARWLHYRNWIPVFHINAVEDEREKYLIPPDTWEEKDVDGPSPYPVNDGDAFEVREFEWMEEIGELRVRGTWMSAAKDSELVTSKAHMERVYGSLLDKAETLAQMRAEWSERAVALEEKIINRGAEARERGQMMDRNAAKESWNEMRGAVEEQGDEILPADIRDLAEDEREQHQRTNGHNPSEDR